MHGNCLGFSSAALGRNIFVDFDVGQTGVQHSSERLSLKGKPPARGVHSEKIESAEYGQAVIIFQAMPTAEVHDLYESGREDASYERFFLRLLGVGYYDVRLTHMAQNARNGF